MAEPAVNWSTFVEHAALSDIGLRRANNQDCCTAVLASDQREWRERGHLFMVADGMGAHAAGELASKLACNGIGHTYHKLRDRTPPDGIRQAIIETNAHIHGRGEANAEFHGMGTTCSVLLLLPQGAVVGHVGDSRVYRLRRRKLEQLTFDHSLVWEMTASGQLPKGDAASFIPKNIITRSLGPHAEVKVDLEGPFPLEKGDTFLLCSDGLSGQVKDEQIGAILDSLSPTEAARALVDLANLNGGPDNITVVVARVVQSLELAPEDRVFRTPSATERSQAVHPAVWVGIGVAILIAAGLALTGKLIAAGVALIVGLLAAVIALSRGLQGNANDATQVIAGPLGKGPHTACECTPNAETVRELIEMVKKLREVATEQNWTVSWKGFNDYQQAATASELAGDFFGAQRQALLAISFMMNEIRHQRLKTPTPNSTATDR